MSSIRQVRHEDQPVSKPEWPARAPNRRRQAAGSWRAPDVLCWGYPRVTSFVDGVVASMLRPRNASRVFLWCRTCEGVVPPHTSQLRLTSRTDTPLSTL